LEYIAHWSHPPLQARQTPARLPAQLTLRSPDSVHAVVSHQESALAEHQRQLNAEGNAADASIEALDAAKAQLWEQACEACEARPRKMYASVDAHIRKVRIIQPPPARYRPSLAPLL
jgi:hypothetical protein